MEKQLTADDTLPPSEEELKAREAKIAAEQARADAVYDKTTPKTSLLHEEYKGPSATVTAVGVGAIESKVVWAIGLVAGGLAGAAAPNSINKLEKYSRKFAKEAISGNVKNAGMWHAIKRGAGSVIDLTFRGSDWLLEHLPGGKEAAAKRLGSGGRAKAIITAGGITSLAGVLLSLVHGVFAGVKSARGGKEQFDRAKDEIRALRRENAVLEEELIAATREQLHDRTYHHTPVADTGANARKEPNPTPAESMITKPHTLTPLSRVQKPALEHANMAERTLQKAEPAPGYIRT